MDPIDFCNKWVEGSYRSVPTSQDKRVIAKLLSLSETRVRSWYFSKGKDKSSPKPLHLEHLALMDLVLDQPNLETNRMVIDIKNKLTVSD
jgi:hypothetical protein